HESEMIEQPSFVGMPSAGEVVVGAREGKGLWNVADARLVLSLPPWLDPCDISRDGRWITSRRVCVRPGRTSGYQCLTETVRILDARTGQELRHVQLHDVVFARDGRLLIADAARQALEYWDPAANRLLARSARIPYHFAPDEYPIPGGLGQFVILSTFTKDQSRIAISGDSG